MTKAMTKYDADWAAAEAAKREWMAENGLYSEAEEHSSCGVGLVVSIDGKPSRKVVENGINALKAVWHRGAVDADGKTGDGAGIHVQIPPAFFYDQVVRTGHEPRKDELMAVGRCSCPAPISARRKPAGPSSNPKSCGWATTSTAGATCRSM
jgi:glutamate synthase (NADPH/NADH) large chain